MANVNLLRTAFFSIYAEEDIGSVVNVSFLTTLCNCQWKVVDCSWLHGRM